jgi:hypothetical protein
VLAQTQLKMVVVQRDAGSALHYHPMLFAMQVLLQADLLPGYNANAFDLGPVRLKNRLKPSPRAMGSIGSINRTQRCGHGKHTNCQMPL